MDRERVRIGGEERRLTLPCLIVRGSFADELSGMSSMSATTERSVDDRKVATFSAKKKRKRYLKYEDFVTF